jgi:hypothetical protein
LIPPGWVRVARPKFWGSFDFFHFGVSSASASSKSAVFRGLLVSDERLGPRRGRRREAKAAIERLGLSPKSWGQRGYNYSASSLGSWLCDTCRFAFDFDFFTSLASKSFGDKIGSMFRPASRTLCWPQKYLDFSFVFFCYNFNLF